MEYREPDEYLPWVLGHIYKKGDKVKGGIRMGDKFICSKDHKALKKNRPNHISEWWRFQTTTDSLGRPLNST